jgi:hypothetical protein
LCMIFSPLSSCTTTVVVVVLLVVVVVLVYIASRHRLHRLHLLCSRLLV